MARNFVYGSTDRVEWASGGPLLYNQTSASVVFWFKVPDLSAKTGNGIFFRESAAFNKNVQCFISAGTGGTLAEGRIQIIWRTPTANAFASMSSGALDDNAWHRYLAIRRSTSPYVELYIDAVSVASTTTDPTTDATADSESRRIGNNHIPDGGLGGSIARFAFFAGTVLTTSQADSFLYTGRTSVKPDLWLELMGASTEPDWSGHALAGTVTGATIVDHASVAPWFGFEWQTTVASRIVVKQLAALGVG